MPSSQELEMDVVIIICVICGVLSAAILSAKDKAGTGCLVGFLLGPIGLIWAFIERSSKSVYETQAEAIAKTPVTVKIEQSEPIQNKEELRDCPFCAEPIKKAAKLCKHCKSEVAPEPSQ